MNYELIHTKQRRCASPTLLNADTVSLSFEITFIVHMLCLTDRTLDATRG